MKLPDFRAWAENIILIARQNGTANEEIALALEQAYKQGYYIAMQKAAEGNYKGD